ncbi:MAG: trypsin-like peptidase domain-containing protein, partial [Lachnospiraceae bacterium]|nr:trypsin-like peptidase domain-containing protein [Lachnospiraceae bacterium]
LIATNNHVVESAKTISVQFIDEQVYEATVKGKDSGADLAVIAVKLKDLKKDTVSKIAIAKLGDSNQARVGEKVVAIGNSLGYGQSVTVGYLSAKDREIYETDNNGNKKNVITVLQTDAAINPGNSGGPLINMRGEVIGINSAKIASSSVEGVGYAIPISDANPIINELKDKEAVKEGNEGYLGITGISVSNLDQSLNLPDGVYINEVNKGGASDKAGLVVGDIITKVNNTKIDAIESLKDAVNGYNAGTKVTITYLRLENGEYKENTTKVTLEKKNDSAPEETTAPEDNGGYSDDDFYDFFGGMW